MNELEDASEQAWQSLRDQIDAGIEYLRKAFDGNRETYSNFYNSKRC